MGKFSEDVKVYVKHENYSRGKSEKKFIRFSELLNDKLESNDMYSGELERIKQELENTKMLVIQLTKILFLNNLIDLKDLKEYLWCSNYEIIEENE